MKKLLAFAALMPVFMLSVSACTAGKTVIPFRTCCTAEYEALSDIVKATPTANHADGLSPVTQEETGGKDMASKHAQIDSWLKSIGS